MHAYHCMHLLLGMPERLFSGFMGCRRFIDSGLPGRGCNVGHPYKKHYTYEHSVALASTAVVEVHTPVAPVKEKNSVQIVYCKFGCNDELSQLWHKFSRTCK